MKYIFIFLPFVGVFIGLISVLWYKLAIYLDLSPMLYAAIGATIPIFLSGGIHLDGFIDTCDAAASRGSFEKKAEILKDPHIGAFAVISCAVYFVILFGVYCEFFISKCSWIILFFVFVLSRALGALASVTFVASKKSGLLFAFSEKADKKPVIIVLLLYIVLSVAVIYFFITFFALIALIVLSILYFVWFKYFSRNTFGGMSGDLAGFYVSTCELIFILTASLLKVQ